MQCCVPNCGSKELKPNKSDNSGITYHEFPKDFQTRSQWMQGLRLGDWRPDSNSVVCSLHFSGQHFMQSVLCARGTDVDDVPVPAEVLCRMCLSSDTKVYNIGDNEIAQQYELLTATKDCVGDILPQHICWECKARLASFARLRSVALRSLQLLQEFYETVKSQERTQDVQLIIDRDTNNLTSSLVQSNVELVDYPPNSELMVVFDVESDNTVSPNLGNRNDNDKESTEVNNVNDNSNFNVVNENDNSGLNNVSYYLGNRPIVSTSNGEGKNDENESDNFANLEGDNFENFGDDADDTLEADIIDETLCQKTDTVDYNSGLEDMIYDSDSSESENEDIKSKVNADLEKIAHIFTDNKICLIRRDFNCYGTKYENGKKDIDENPSIDKDLKETFVIKQLSYGEQLKEFHKRKESNNYKKAEFKCDECYRGFINKDAYDLHKISHTDVMGPLKCPVCGCHYTQSRYLRNHIKQSHQNRYSCNKCNYVTGAQYDAKIHVRYHEGTIYKCSQCNKVFKKRTSCFSHIRTQHPSDFVCRLCGHSFVSGKGLGYHTAKKHQQKLEMVKVPEDGPRCDECDIQFSTDAALTTHYQESNKHKHLFQKKKLRKRRASDDSKVYGKPKGKRVLKIKVPVICEVCNIELPNHMKYRWHFKVHHPDQVRTKFPGKFMCENCGLFFTCQAVLDDHKQSVHADVRKMYSCQQCGKKLTTKYSLFLHKETHLNERMRYSCDICENTFCSYSNLYRHKILHENRKFNCNICGKSFKHPQNRQNHINYVHKKKPLPARRNRVRGKKGKKDSTESLQ